jgi:flavin reductase (DIM6/NTAB) family NADH-FMN oxidoreductase RutF
MSKLQQRPYAIFYPAPVVLVTSVDKNGQPNVATFAWAGTVSTQPPQVCISVRPHRYSYEAIKQSGEFVINLPSQDQLAAVDRCGEASRAEGVDKFALTGLTPVPAAQVRAPLIAQCPVNMECKVTQSVPIGSHVLFIGEIVAVHVEDSILDAEGFIDFTKAKPIAYLGNEYWSLGERLQRAAFTLGNRA